MTDTKKKPAPQRAPRKRAKAKSKSQDEHADVPITEAPAREASRARPAQTGRAARTQPASEPSAPLMASIPLHVRWRDLDALNHVNNAAYLTFLEESRMQWLQDVRGEWFNEHAVPVMAAVELHYRQPITWPAEIDVEFTCERLGNSSITIGNRIVARNAPQRVYADGSTVVVWVDPATGTSVSLPQAIRDACGG
jgi:acyl-CoA thioester hydrolase